MSDTNHPVQLQKIVRSLKFLIYEEQELYYPCSKNKGTDRSYCEADLHLCFCIGKYPVFSSPEPKAHKVSL